MSIPGQAAVENILAPQATAPDATKRVAEDLENTRRARGGRTGVQAEAETRGRTQGAEQQAAAQGGAAAQATLAEVAIRQAAEQARIQNAQQTAQARIAADQAAITGEQNIALGQRAGATVFDNIKNTIGAFLAGTSDSFRSGAVGQFIQKIGNWMGIEGDVFQWGEQKNQSFRNAQAEDISSERLHSSPDAIRNPGLGLSDREIGEMATKPSRQLQQRPPSDIGREDLGSPATAQAAPVRRPTFGIPEHTATAQADTPRAPAPVRAPSFGMG